MFGLSVALSCPDIGPVALQVIAQDNLVALNRRHIRIDDGRLLALRHVAQEARVQNMNAGEHAWLGWACFRLSSACNTNDPAVRAHLDQPPTRSLGVRS